MSAETDPQTAREQAAAWLMRLHEGPVGLEEELELELWLEAHPANREAMTRVARAWRMAGEAADLPGLIAARADALKAMGDAGRRASQGRQLGLPYALAALAACLLLIVTATFYFYSGGETYRTGVGERRVIVLDDGSQLSLDAASAVEVRYDGERRALRLLAGRARFEVAKDPRRPFTVTAGGRVVVATGTAFSVELLHAEMRVVLYEGSVSVLEDSPADQAPRHVLLPGKSRIPADRMLTPSTALIVPAGSSVAARLETVDVARSASWEQGQLVFSDEPLGVAVERVNRYSDARLLIEDPATAALPVSGTFNAGDTEGFVDGVATLYGLRKLRHNNSIVLEPAAR
ncbi:FecR domain-containing protein [Sphingomonas sp. JC676]|uniref:FecR family protein n=1 Tax=Sphingomonas sp. JC676 TaxID=2768065 RepID=UPI0016579465|nr:FecR domain-containing protein [Sphingomonas sp. JC676]MBC9035038.1 FecR domain-containing protein [Sphingomonas sp. JC676]